MNKHHYDLVVIGGGGAGITAALTAAGLGKHVAMIEGRKIGGECTWSGCIPSKALIKAASAAHHVSKSNEFGIQVIDYAIDREKVMNYVRSRINHVYEEEKPEVFKQKGIEVYSGYAKFIDENTVAVDDVMLSSKKIIIATGTTPVIPEIEGIHDISYLTNETIFQLKKLPHSVIMVGGGAIAVELSQALNRLGVEVTMILRSNQLLNKEDDEIIGIIENILLQEGVKILYHQQPVQLRNENGYTVVVLKSKENEVKELRAETIVFATGRQPNTEDLNLDSIGVKTTKDGVSVDEYMKTSISNIYACGDVVGPYRFSHMAEVQGTIAALNATLPIKRKIDYSNVLWSIFTDPEIAHLGLTEKEARNKYGDKIKVFRYNFKDLDRAKTDNIQEGLIKYICTPKGKILGVHIIGERAGELIHEAQIFKSLNISINKMQKIIHAYPTYSDINRKIGKMAYIQSLEANFFVKILRKLLSQLFPSS